MSRGYSSELFRIILATPYQRGISRAVSEEHQYLAALKGIHLPLVMPFLLDVWRGRKVLSIQWNEGTVDVISFRRGEWEEQLLEGSRSPAAQQQFIGSWPISTATSSFEVH
jgi:hypothetical protein